MNNNLSKPEIQNNRTTVSLSKTNHLILKKLSYRFECDSIDKTISRLLEKEFDFK